MSNLLRYLSHHRSIEEWLHHEFPDEDDDTLRDTLEGLSTLPEALAATLRSHLDDVALAEALRARLWEMQGRLSRIEGRAEKKRTLVASVMERADLRKLTEPDFTVSLRPTPPPLVVTAESEIPAAYWAPTPEARSQGSYRRSEPRYTAGWRWSPGRHLLGSAGCDRGNAESARYARRFL